MEYKIGQEMETYRGTGTIEAIYAHGDKWGLHVLLAGGWTVLTYRARTTA